MMDRRTGRQAGKLMGMEVNKRNRNGSQPGAICKLIIRVILV